MLDLNFNPFPLIETERLVLRNYTMEDAADVFAYRSNVDAMKHIAKPIQTSLEDARIMIQKINDMVDTNTGIGWGITLKGTPKIIGAVSFHRIEVQHERAEIGYMLHPDYWRKGIITEAVKAIIDYGFTMMKLHSIEAHIDPDNRGSKKVLSDAGFVKEAYFRENYCYNGKFMDTEVYSLLSPVKSSA